MRIDSAGFAEINQNPNRKPRYTIKIEWEGDPVVDYWLTSHKDAKTPTTVSSDDIGINLIRDISGTSQKISPIKAISTIGSLSFSVIDKDGELTNKINTEYGEAPVTAADKGLRGKTVKVYIGEEGLEWDDYVLIQTQIIRNVTFKDGIYTFECADIQRTVRTRIFDIKRTTLLENLNYWQKGIPLVDVTDFESVQHGTSYSDLPNEKVGYIRIQDEIIAWRGKQDTQIVSNGTDVQFIASNRIYSPSIDFTQYEVGMTIEVQGSASNSKTFSITSRDANNLYVDNTIVAESAGPSITITAEVQLYNCTRGALNTKAVNHVMSDPLPTEDRRLKVEEVVYLELPAPKMIYAILTGGIYGTSDVLPDHWNLGISTQFVATSEFINVGEDLWDTTDDTLGFPVRFIEPKKSTGKKFIEEELLLLSGLFIPILNDGQMGLRRMTNILSDASPSMVLDEANVISISPLRHNMEEVYNYFEINWNWDRVEKRFTRSTQFVDGDSVTRHGLSKAKVMNFQGLHGSVATASTLVNRADGVRDRHAGPPQEITVKCMFEANVLEVGDIVRLQLDNLQDFVTGGSISRSFEVQQVRTNWRDGTVSLSLFGSSQAAAESVDDIITATALDNSFYTASGTDISTVTTGSAGGGTWTITGNSSLTGNDNLISSSAIYYYDGDVTINSGVNLNISKNVQLRISGDLTINGTINGEGTGTDSPALRYGDYYSYYSLTNLGPRIAPEDCLGTAGAMGTTQPHGSIVGQYGIPGNNNTFQASISSGQMPATVGTWQSLPPFGLVNNGTSILGLPTNLQGTSGGQGGACGAPPNATTWLWADLPGGKGGKGGAGLCIIAKNVFAGASGSINLSGGAGQDSPNVKYIDPNPYYRALHASDGAGGAPGGLLIIIDGNGVADTSIVNQFYGVSQIRQPRAEERSIMPAEDRVHCSYYVGANNRLNPSDYNNNVRGAFTRVQRLTIATEAEIDVPDETSVASVISLQEVGPTATTLNQTAIEVSVSAPSGTGPYIDNYDSSHVYARNISGSPATQDSWFDIGYVGPVGELSFSVPADGSTWEVKAHPVSTTGSESLDFISDTISVTATLETVISTGNSIATGTDPATSGGIVLDTTGIVAYDGTGTPKVTIDADTGLITAVDGDFSGTISADAGDIGGWTIASGKLDAGTAGTHIELNPTSGIFMGADTLGAAPFSVTTAGALTAESGSIGGWDITSTTIESTNNRVTLDGANNRIQVEDAIGTNYVRLDADGVTGVDSVLGTVFRLPTDGSAPTFSSGIINTTIFNITSSGILRTSDTVGTGSPAGAGVLINDTGIKGYKINDTTPVFTLDATDGSMTCTDATISGTITVGAGSTGVANLSDAGDLATRDTVNGSYIDNLSVDTIHIADRATMDYSYSEDNENVNLSAYGTWEEMLMLAHTYPDSLRPDYLRFTLEQFGGGGNSSLVSGDWLTMRYRYRVFLNGPRDGITQGSPAGGSPAAGTYLSEGYGTLMWVGYGNDFSYRELQGVESLWDGITVDSSTDSIYVYLDWMKDRGTTSSSLDGLFTGANMSIEAYYK